MATQGRGCKPACLGPGISLTSPGSTSAPSMGSQQPGSRGRGRGTGFSGCDGTMGSLVPLPLPLCTALSPGVPWGKKSVLLGLGAGEPLTLPFGRWQALRAASTRFRSAGNIWKKLEKTKRERPAGQRDRCQPRGELVEVWEGSWGTHFFTGIFPSALSCILSFTRLQGQRAVCQGLGADAPAAQAKDSRKWAGRLHLVQECDARGIGRQRVLGQGKDILGPVLSGHRAQHSSPL